MKPIFSIHAGEYLVGSHIEAKYKDFNIWLPSKDTGIDLLVTNKTSTKAVSLQVKFSKDYFGSEHGRSEIIAPKVKAGGWWKFELEKIKESKADLWILVVYGFVSKNYDFVIIEPAELFNRYKQLNRNQKTIQSYIWVTVSKKCWETRGLRKVHETAIANDTFTDSVRDLTAYLNNWNKLEIKLIQ